MDHNNGGTTMVHMMQMTFVNNSRATLLWDWWSTSGPATYIPSLIALVLLGICTVYLKAARMDLDPKIAALAPWKAAVCRGVGAALSVTLDYLLMLCVMSFNVGVFVAVVLGIAVGVGSSSAVLQHRASTKDKEGEALLGSPAIQDPAYCDCPCARSMAPKLQGTPPTGEAPGLRVTELDPNCCPP
eukprot:Protomagalhaensia_sp_Gyna_25__3420@NODE_308_length_3960_cov_111_493497_g239_i0_p4_GENE_NODE_308_length_3960_cov_111_493497_g239_i0NODE_308_length_3960_cov_111_493497_g239_i0_p4_ORF_typecomplete_len186_score19_39Ctr/PF04145_15/3_3e20LapA_dom/PF06305_11/4e03LapA_dom/PF06305_11/0_42_NODE_308_length_3960_cov_111_493497_g239_i016672224